MDGRYIGLALLILKRLEFNTSTSARILASQEARDDCRHCIGSMLALMMSLA